VTAPLQPLIVSGPEALAEFRQGLTGERILGCLAEARGRLLVSLGVGVGKTELMVKTIVHSRSVVNTFDLVLVLVPRRDILEEIRRRLPPDADPVVLEPRPRRRCGDLDARWGELESAGCGLLAKEQICAGCPRRKACSWPGQLSRERLKGVGPILATQHHLAINPSFVHHLRHHTQAERVLVLLDESDLLVKAVRRSIRRSDLLGFIAAQEAALAETDKPTAARGPVSTSPACSPRHLRRTSRRAGGDSPGSRATGPSPSSRPGWLSSARPPFPRVRAKPLRPVRPGQPRADRGGGHRVRVPTDLGSQFVVFSGSIARGLARYRLDPDHCRFGLVSPFEHHRFEHPETGWYNLRSIAGADKYFLRNAPTILDFFAAKIAANIRTGRRTLLIAKKKVVHHCAAELTRRLDGLGVGPVRLVTGDWDNADLSDPRTLPLINYGVSGVNRFEGHDCAYCLTGYYTSAATVAAAVHDLDPSTERIPVRLVFAGDPPHRQAVVDLPDDRETILPQVARWVLQQKEHDMVIQAVGRVRPFTKPREVVTFQVGDLPDVRYTLQFRSLASARSHFRIPTRRQSAAEARRLKALGLTRAQIATAMNVSKESVKRYLRTGGVTNP
jgi:hypothetical protein